MGTVQHLQVDVHVVRQLPETFGALLLGCPVHALAVGKTLREKLPGLVAHADVHEAIVGVLYLAHPEAAETHACEHSVVEDLRMDVELAGMLLNVAKVQQVTGGLEVIVQCQVIGLEQGRTPLKPDLASSVDVLAEFGHETLRVLGPDPIVLLVLWHGVVDRLVDLFVKAVRLEVDLIHHSQRNEAARMRLIRLLEELQHALHQDQAIRGVGKDLLVLLSIDVQGILQSLVELVVELIYEGHEELLLSHLRRGVFSVVSHWSGTAVLDVIMVSLDQQWQHRAHLTQSLLPPLNLHSAEGTAGAIKISRDHGRPDVKLMTRTLLHGVGHQCHELLLIRLLVKAATATLLRNLLDLLDELF
mmetsp:Transcript_4458/g.10335  ORF Transcript_4458/g.10335 Transcript_4458/m.10335 type:complete len:359 (+) Transcript_4458:1048-2124(+)